MTTRTRLATTLASDWSDHAACHDVDPELFFPVGENIAARTQAEQAKKHCQPCPVREACLQWALETRQDSGVWGGMSEAERRAIHGRRPPGHWAARGLSASVRLYETRGAEVAEMAARDVPLAEIAAALKTNMQTVNRVLECLAADEAAKVVTV
jgi:WhiB family redox-sensing transcriptional regulator